ncbi:MAG TPA: hypothetical protein VHP11_14440 [Tepidisphaeraceae bacterium]|nr:hypothetical protein [Tepidisphaeraceae bacterium]
MFKTMLIAAVGVLFWLWRSGRLGMWMQAAGRAGLLAGNGGGEPRCGQCGYIVRGIGGFTCPECGKDLREVGIVTRRQNASGWSSVVPLVIVWSVGMYAMGTWVVDAAIRALPQRSRVIYTVRLERPQSHAYHVVTMQGGDVGRMDSGAVVVPRRTLNLMSLAGRNSAVDLDLPAGNYAYTGGDGTRCCCN